MPLTRNASARRAYAHPGRFLGLILLLLPLAAGCGGSAYTDVDLNTGEALGPEGDQRNRASTELMMEMEGAGEDPVYRIHPGDVLEVVFFTHPEQNRFVTVRPDGRITLPYLGEMTARDKHPTDLAQEIQTAYAEVLVQPRVDILVDKMNSRFYVLGEVGRSGEYELDQPTSLLQGVARAGGFSNAARLTNFVLIREDGEGGRYAAIFDFRQYMASREKVGDVPLRAGDIVWVPMDNISRFDNAASKTLQSVVRAEDTVFRALQISNFDEVYQRVTP